MFDEDDIHFTWDEAKAVANLRKHGVAFEDAIFVFGDPHRLEESDFFVREEYRNIVIGAVGSAVLTVVFTEPEEGLVRIISARKATANERRIYEHNLFQP